MVVCLFVCFIRSSHHSRDLPHDRAKKNVHVWTNYYKKLLKLFAFEVISVVTCVVQGSCTLHAYKSDRETCFWRVTGIARTPPDLHTKKYHTSQLALSPRPAKGGKMRAFKSDKCLSSARVDTSCDNAFYVALGASPSPSSNFFTPA